jgi:hypothetical protein
MANEYVKLSKAQKEEIRRLTQLANRRIKAAFKAYEKEGKSVMPYEVVGNVDIREKWDSEKYALSRSIKFATQNEYKMRLKYLRQFEKERPGIKEYTKIQREKTKIAMETSLGQELPNYVSKVIDKMTAPQLSDFWQKFNKKSAKLGMKYSSNEAMAKAMQDYFQEDIEHLYTDEQKAGLNG